MAASTVSKTRRSPERNTAGQQGQCRIVAGRWRGRKVKFKNADGLRPTTDRIRETVFNWLQAYLPGSVCLDCFSGSGVLGFEALSRGAREVVFIEQNEITVTGLRDTAREFHADDAVIMHDDVKHWLSSVRLEERPKFDLVFLDPPFRTDLLEVTSELLNHSGCLAEDALIYVEHAVDDNVVLPGNWSCLKQKSSGQVAYKLFEYQTSGE